MGVQKYVNCIDPTNARMVTWRTVDQWMQQ